MRLRITGPGGNSDDVEDMLASQAGAQRYPTFRVDTAIGSHPGSRPECPAGPLLAAWWRGNWKFFGAGAGK
jgi:hypothetical protein